MGSFYCSNVVCETHTASQARADTGAMTLEAEQSLSRRRLEHPGTGAVSTSALKQDAHTPK